MQKQQSRWRVAHMTRAFNQMLAARGAPDASGAASTGCCDRCHAALTPAEQAEAATQADCYATCAVCQDGA